MYSTYSEDYISIGSKQINFMENKSNFEEKQCG